jgi:hypothetical protein
MLQTEWLRKIADAQKQEPAPAAPNFRRSPLDI